MNKPKTIADLDINWTFTPEHRYFLYFKDDFIVKNPELNNFKIKKENYIFEIEISGLRHEFSIFIDDNDCNDLHHLMFYLQNKIREFTFGFSYLKLIKFKETVFFNVFVIEVEES